MVAVVGDSCDCAFVPRDGGEGCTGVEGVERGLSVVLVVELLPLCFKPRGVGARMEARRRIVT